MLLFYLTFLACLVVPSVSVKHDTFKTCAQSGFCKRNRAFADNASSISTWQSPYALDPNSIAFNDGKLSGTILKKLDNSKEKVRLPIIITFLESGTVRITIDEEKRQKGDIVLRHDSKVRKERYNEAANWAIVGGLEPNKGAALSNDAGTQTTKVLYGPAGAYEAVLRHSPFGIDFNRDGKTHIQLNERGLLNVEHWRAKVEKETIEPKEGEEQQVLQDTATESTEDESTWWEESFGGNTDSKPRGPESIGLDISFPGYDHVYGIPEHASSMSLKQTRGGDGGYTDPYRLYNSDVFEYELDSPMTLYGVIPLMQAQAKDSTVGVFWLNAAETWVDIIKGKSVANALSLGVAGKSSTQTHWFSESGQLDLFVFLGPTPKDITKKYGELTGYSQLPQASVIGYHQCRWNYVTDQDVMDVDRKFDKHRIPYDVIWLDIEYTDGKKYFTWDPLNFPHPDKMHKQLDEHERKVVVIIDPHIKNENNYHVDEDLRNKDLGVHNKEGSISEGWCWPGSSHWIDSFNPAARAWWKSLYQFKKFIGTAKNTFLWNDMNEPSVFNGPETTMPKDNIHYGNWEHRDVHNIYGMTVHNATHEGLIERKKGEIQRPFVLSRAFFAGSQRLGAVWTGDNLADWGHLRAALPMLLNQGISGFPFVGSDVGGFFGNPTKELLTRWYQSGTFYPFFRGHAHIDTRRREPYLAGTPYTQIITQAIRLRYSLLPAWYTAFHEASIDGSPIIRPNFYVHPSDEKGFAIDDQLYIGSTGLLAKPIVQEGAESADIYIADDEPYYDYFDYTVYSGKGSHTYKAPLEKIPLLMQGGHIIPRRDRPRRSSGLMRYDPYTLLIVLDKAGNAEGSLYVDDGETFDYQQGAYIHRKFSFNQETGILSSEDISTKGSKTAAYLKAMAKVRVERVIIVGAPNSWKSKTQVSIAEEGAKDSSKKKSVSLQYHAAAGGKGSWAVVRDPGVLIAKGWKIDFS
ncbi:glycoside hydrolase family 31 protein [Patellaria atrata CBS 101060]|uniref:alpha-glucosidase n=1 Tax=Patellaria atrata CBS 101060 TaxID=1346257 RepID=A0A9P4SEC7_9PEZI|nr:glycoside hydrolase family 31 protein [Patellaria atrata CBS 101060]